MGYAEFDCSKLDGEMQYLIKRDDEERIARTVRPVRVISIALCFPTVLTSLVNAPAMATTPIFTSGNANVAVGVARTMSALIAISLFEGRGALV